MNKSLKYRVEELFFFKIYYTTLTYKERMRTNNVSYDLTLCGSYLNLLDKTLGRRKR